MPAIITPAAVAAAAAAELPRIFDDALDTLREGEAQYLRDGMPTSVPGKISQAAGRSACRIYATGNVDLNPAAAEKYERACRPYLDDIYPPTGPVIEYPFPGGQCPGQRYLLQFRGRLTNPLTDTGIVSVVMRGPLVLDTSLNPGDTCTPPVVYKRWTLRGANNAAQGLWAGCTATIEIISVTALDGGDGGGCGNPDPVVRQPEPNPDPSPPPFRFNPGPEIDVDVDVDVDGRITVNVGTGPITVDPFGGGDGGDGGGPTGPGPGDIGDAGGASDTGSGGEAEGEAGAGEILVGIKVDILASPPRARQYAPGIFRGAGYFYMGVAGNLDQDYGGAMLKSGQFFFAEKDNLTHWSVSANNGYNFRVTPYYREAPE